MAAPFPNVYHRRMVAPGAAKACFICYKQTTVVLITPDNKDFFYVCSGHLLDRGFAIPNAEDAAKLEEQKNKEALDKEIEAVKKEYEEKVKRRKGKAKDEDKDKNKNKETKEEKAKAEDREKEREEQDRNDEKELREKIRQMEGGDKPGEKKDDGPRIFALHKSVYSMRVNRIRQAQAAKREQERLRNPIAFPSAPSGDLR